MQCTCLYALRTFTVLVFSTLPNPTPRPDSRNRFDTRASTAHISTAGAATPTSMDLESLCDGVAVITGSASGLGLAMAQACCERGMQAVVLSDVRSEALQQAVKELQSHQAAAGRSTSIVGFVCDVTNLSSVKQLLQSVLARYGTTPIRFVAANAGAYTCATPCVSELAVQVLWLDICNQPPRVPRLCAYC